MLRPSALPRSRQLAVQACVNLIPTRTSHACGLEPRHDNRGMTLVMEQRDGAFVSRLGGAL